MEPVHVGFKKINTQDLSRLPDEDICVSFTNPRQRQVDMDQSGWQCDINCARGWPGPGKNKTEIRDAVRN